MRVIDPADFLFENEVLKRWPMLTKAELRRARRANPPRIEFYSFRKKSGGPRYTPEQVQSYIDRTYLRISECPQLDSRAPHQALSSSGDFSSAATIFERPHPEHLGFWYACRYDPGTRQVRRRSLKTTDFEEAKVRLAALVASAPSSANRVGPPGPDQILSVAALKAYLDERGVTHCIRGCGRAGGGAVHGLSCQHKQDRCTCRILDASPAARWLNGASKNTGIPRATSNGSSM